MLLIFEISKPFRAKPKIERVGVIHRFIWGWFAVAIFSCRLGDLFRAFVDYGRENPQIKDGE